MIQIFLVLMIFPMNDGTPQVFSAEAPSVSECMDQAAKFLEKSPRDFGAAKIAAACRVEDKTDPA